jgi:hypothetical protein
MLRGVVAVTLLSVAIGLGESVSIAGQAATSQGQSAANRAGPDAHEHEHDAPVPFTANGCSGFREGKFYSCCFVHDFAFWAGGSRDDRHQADVRFRQCLIDVTQGNLYDRAIADIGFLLMILERIPGEVVNDGWGRGWPKRSRRKYQPLSADQRALVRMERERVCGVMTYDPRSGRYRYNDSRELLPIVARSLCGTY